MSAHFWMWAGVCVGALIATAVQAKIAQRRQDRAVASAWEQAEVCAQERISQAWRDGHATGRRSAQKEESLRAGNTVAQLTSRIMAGHRAP